METISLEQLEVLMLVAGSEEPLQTAVRVRRRWQYILTVARAAQQGQALDRSLPQVIQDCDDYVRRAQRIVAVLDGWLTERTGRSASDIA